MGILDGVLSKGANSGSSGSPLGALASATPWGAAANILGNAISTPNTSAATSGDQNAGKYSFEGIQTGGSSGFPWYVWAGLAAVAVIFVLRR